MRYSSIAVLALAFSAWFVPLLAAEKSIDDLIGQLNSDIFAEREQAARDLVALGPKALEPLRKAFQSPDKEITRRAKECVAQIERNEQIAGFLAQLNDFDPKRRVAAIGGLQRLQYDPEKLAGVLLRALDDPDPELRCGTAHSLADLGPPGRQGIPRMLEILKDEKEPDRLRWHVTLSLGRLGNCEDATPVLLKLLDSKNAELRGRAASALGSLGKKHPEVVPALLKALNDPDDDVRSSAVWSLGKLGKEPDTCVPALIIALRSWKPAKGKSDARHGVLRALERYGSAAVEAVPLICDIVTEETKRGNLDFLKQSAFLTLEAIGPAAVPALTKLYEGDDPLISREAARALTKLTGIMYEVRK